jgi:hypothetical protein
MLGGRWSLVRHRPHPDPRGRGSDHAAVLLERDTLPHRPAAQPWPGDALSWRNIPRGAVTVHVLSAILLACLGVLLGATWTIQASQPKLRRQAEERRRLNEQWSAVRTARRQRRQCPRCGNPLTDHDWYRAPATVDDPLDDD